MKAKILKGFKWFGILLLSTILLVVIAFQVSPRPGAYVIRHLFSDAVTITDKETYEQAKDSTSSLTDRSYQSQFKKNNYDIYYPKGSEGHLPTLIWVHGGGYVSGDKAGVKEFATRLASDTHIAVVAMNYEPAPSSQYPNQVVQVNELVQQLKKENNQKLDLSKLIFGGDSAGAQIALQYVTIQTNQQYAKEMKMKQMIDPTAIKGAISYCGPVDLQQTAKQQSSDRLMHFFVKTVAWSLIGTKDWQIDERLYQASLVDQVSKDFPPTYITDGNAYSFQDQGIAFANKLKELDVPVDELFYKDQKKEISHEYQFNYTLPESKTCYEQTERFIENCFRSTTAQ
ncbi:esterase [Enterococcus hirae EnGen0127]|uniref:alpha/beta hydrolase n=1 Tax=Enterococcus hirae TaxID=1354 RepID=UPI00032ECCAE|nr:alpha/beta hydrolase [Enterococcus hirae]EOF60981.1 esterase [Enterococcus hirae EnGen0127]OWW47300.1 esterase [Enterococcus hirae 81-15-F4]OWW61983.1 esterase [Enterococcus hirae 88-15-E09]